MNNPYVQLAREGTPATRALYALAEEAFSNCRHGDLLRWTSALESLPSAEHHFDGSPEAPVLGKPVGHPAQLKRKLMQLHPWRKGPLVIGGIEVDTEWRSDLKWGRVAPHIDVRGHTVLDIGCGNGYFGWRMLAAGARQVIGIDPTWVFIMQWLACHHFAGDVPNHVLPLRAEDLPTGCGGFDSVMSMGVLYHRRDPLEHLAHLVSLAIPGGQVVIETLVLDVAGEHELRPEGRYARMRNVHAIPSPDLLIRWAGEAGLNDAAIIDVSPTTSEEQRSTEWMTFESLDQCLDAGKPTRTVEGFPAPVRAVLVARTAPTGSRPST